MKLISLLLLVTLFNVCGSISFAQNARLNLDLKDVSIQNVISSIENQSEFFFLYSPKMINVNQKVSIHAAGETLMDVLNELFAGTGIKYSIRDRQILLVNNEIDLTTLMQKNRIIGTVTDQQGVILPGVNVSVKGTTNGTFTDSYGKYALNNVAQNATLVFTFVSMADQEIQLNGRTMVDVVMSVEAVGLQEVVVTALGIQSERKSLGFNTTTVKSDDIMTTHPQNFTEALQGKIAGGKISSVTAKHGSALQIILRGGSSITGNNEPLFVLNGVPFDAANYETGSGLNDLDPSTIESVDVLRGATASALYGSKAANGVILITTKSGAFDTKPTITISHSSSFDKAIQMKRNSKWAQGIYNWDPNGDGNPSDGRYEYVDGETQFTPFSFGPLIKDVPGAKVYDTYKMGVFQTGYTADNTVSMQGGDRRSSYFVSVNVLNNTGVVPEQLNFFRQSFTANTSFKFTDKLTVSSNVTYSRQGGNYSPEGWQNVHFMNTFLMEPLTWNPYPLFDANGNTRSYRGGGRDPWLWIRDYTRDRRSRNRFLGSVNIEYKFDDHFKFKSTTGVSTAMNDGAGYTDWGGVYTSKFDSGVGYSESLRRDVETTNLLMYDNKFGDFKVSAFFGQNAVSNWSRSMSAGGGPLIIPHVFNLNNVGHHDGGQSYWQQRAFSLMGEVRLAYKDMLYYTITGRNDWPSTLKNNYFYSSHSLGFVFSELIPDKSILNFGKVRVSYAKVGSPAGVYANNVLLSRPQNMFVDFPFNGMMSYLPGSSYPNPNLVNEMKSEIEWGFNLNFLNNRVGVDFSQYFNKSNNQIIWSPMLPETGFNGGNVNIGGITHQGVEITITGSPFKTSDFTWDITLNWAADKSLVKSLGPINAPVGVGWEGAAVVGQPYPVIYGEALLHDANGNLVKNDQGDQNNRTSYGDWIMDPTGNKTIAKIMPDWTAGLKNSFTYKRFSLSALFTSQMGGHVYSLLAGYFERFGMSAKWDDRPADGKLVLPGVMGHWDYATGKVVVTDPNPDNTVWTRFDNHSVNDYWNDERQTQPTDFIRLKELTISYDLPESIAKKAYMKGLRISLSGNNLWRKFAKGFYGMDPEFVTSADPGAGGSYSPLAGNAAAIYGYPPNKTYTISLNVTF